MKRTRRISNPFIAATIPVLAMIAVLTLSPEVFVNIGAQTTPSVIYYSFDPPVIPVNRTDPVLFQVAVSGSPTQVILQYTAIPPTTNLELRDDGSNGDPIAGDGVYSVLLTAAQVTQGLTADDVFRRFLGFLKLFQGATQVSQSNVVADVFTEQIPRPQLTVLAADAQRNDAVVNLVVPGFYNANNVVSSFDYRLLGQRFYQLFGDDYDFFNVIVTPSYLQNRFHFGIRNNVQGIGLSQFNNTAQYGSAGRLQGISAFPIPQLFDGADNAYQHELGHQWINFLQVAPVNGGIPHWPYSSLAGGVMGFSLPGGAGGSFPCVLTSEPGGVRLTPRTAPAVFTDLDLYLMGMLPPEEVGQHLIFNNQTEAAALPCSNQLYTGQMTQFNVSNVVNTLGPRIPGAANAQRNFRAVTIIVSRAQLLSEEAMAFYSYFARRAEGTQDVPFHLGLAKGTARPFALTTGGRGTLNARLQNGACPAVSITPATLPSAIVGTPYQQTLTANAGQSPYDFIITAGAFPDGLTFTAAGNLSGTPTTAGTFNVTVRATDANGCAGERAYSLTVAANNGLMFYPLTHPVRLLETRNNPALPGCFKPNAKIPAGGTRTQSARGVCDGLTIPAGALAITGNITTVESGGGYLTLWPSDAAQPTVANSNYGPNEILNNVFTVGLSAATGEFNIFVTSATDVVIDVTGYYAPPGAGGLYFHPLPTPIRLLETRSDPNLTGCFKPNAPLAANTDTPQQARGLCQGVTIPANAQAIVGNATTVNPGGGYFTLYPSGAARPTVASSNYLAGQVINAPFTVGLGANGAFMIFPTSSTDLVIDVLGYYSPDATDVNGAGLLFTPLSRPVRLLETRNNPALPGCYKPNAPLAGGSIRTQPAWGTCDGLTIPPTALGLIGNATTVNPLGGYLTFWPSTASQPTVATSNFTAGQVFNRHFLVGLGATDGAFKIFTLTQTDLVIDLSGYFAP